MNAHVVALLDAHVDGEASPEDRRKVARHVAACDACAARLAELERLRALLATAAASVPGAPAERFWQALAPALLPRRPDLGRSWLWAGPMLIGGAVAQVVPVVALVVGVAAAAGYPVWHLVAVAAPWLAGVAARVPPSLIAATGRWVGWSTGAGWIARLPEPVVAGWLPSVFFLMLAAVLSLGFMTWALAALRRAAPRPVTSY